MVAPTLDWISVVVPAAGIGASNQFEAGGFIRGNDRVAYTTCNITFCPSPFTTTLRRTARPWLPGSWAPDTDVRSCAPIRRPTDYRDLVFNYWAPNRNGGNGSKPFAVPKHHDPASFRRFRDEELAPELVETDEEILEFIRRRVKAPTTPAAPAKWVSADAVTDPELRVHGVEGSALSMRRSCLHHQREHLYTGLMIAEKVRTIPGNTPLEPLHTYYVKETNP